LGLMWWTAPAPRIEVTVIAVDKLYESAVHMQITTIGLDIAKNVFQVHDAQHSRKGLGLDTKTPLWGLISRAILHIMLVQLGAVPTTAVYEWNDTGFG
jgi:hypothetical protein